VRTPPQLFFLRLGSGFFLGGTMPGVNALIAKLCDKDKQGATYGLSSSISSAGMALGPVVGSTMATAAGYPSVFFVTSAILGAVGLVVGKTARRHTVHDTVSSEAASPREERP
jgi:DHA1 family multidrug resistance protein-like MFS transporter